MKISEHWLREWANPELDSQALSDQLSVSGLEVDYVEPAAPPLTGVIVGEVIAAEQHPNADRLRLCQVKFDGESEAVDVVCGAPNARAGVKYPFATVGAKLPGGVKIRRSKIRGVQSNGMLCSAKELGLGEESDGILELADDAKVGQDITEALGLDDVSIEIELTPNRGDCLSIAGVAREVAVLNRVDLVVPDIQPVPATIDDTFPVTLESPEDCPRYLARVIRNIDPDAKTPLWMVEKLRRCGVRAISPTVDVTNYVMLELGQPMHAFDLNRLERGIRVRKANSGEQLELLDGRVIDIEPDVLVIADEERAVALAGVMGGEQSGVAADTKDLLLECAFFAQLGLAGVARRYGLHTDASHRYERGVDPELQWRATERATQLLLAIVGGEPGPINEAVVQTHVPTRSAVHLRPERISLLLGMDVDKSTVEDVLTRLGMEVSWDGQRWTVMPPSYRFDITIEADLIEEVARIVGYDQVPSTSVQATSDVQPAPESDVPLDRVRGTLVARGYQEAITYSFVEETLQKAFSPELTAFALANPISSDMSVMRTNLCPGLLQAALHNLNRQQTRVRLFETGLRFRDGVDGLAQERVLAGVVTGPVVPMQWGEGTRDADFFDVKGDIEALAELTRGASGFEFQASEAAGLHPGQTATVSRDGDVIGTLGALHPALAREHKLTTTLYLFELSLDALERGEVPRFGSLSRFPAVRRDISIIVDDAVTAQAVRKSVGQSSTDVLKNLELFDVYRGEGIDSGRKSLSLGLTFQADSRTLLDDEIDAAVEAIVSALTGDIGATLRG